MQRAVLAGIGGLLMLCCPVTTFGSTPYGDLDADGLVDLVDIVCALDGFLVPANCSQADVMPCLGDGVIDTDDILAVLDAFAGHPACTVQCPVTLSASPLTGTLGTTVALTLDPVAAPLIFDATATATWEGTYTPLGGSSTSTFVVSYDASQVLEISNSQALISIGDGTFQNAPNPEQLGGIGSLDGTITVSLLGGDVETAASFAIQIDGSTTNWVYIDYADGPGGTAPPVQGVEAEFLDVLPIEGQPTEQELMWASSHHFAAVVYIEENPTSAASAPATITVDLVGFDSAGSEIARIESLDLQRVASDRDPSRITYISDLDTPIVVIGNALDPALYPNLILFFGVDNGSAIITPNM